MTEPRAVPARPMVTSLVIEGVFERFPKLKVVLIEGGFAWLPALGWRLDKHWKRLQQRGAAPEAPPSEYIREHIWVTTQPMEEPEPPRPSARGDRLDRLGPHACSPPTIRTGISTIRRACCRRRQRRHDRRGVLLRQRADAVPARLMARHVVAAGRRDPAGQRASSSTSTGRAIVCSTSTASSSRCSNRCPHQGGSLCEGTLTGLVAIATSPATTTTRGAARSSAAPGTAGSSTSAPGKSWCDPKRIAAAPTRSTSSPAEAGEGPLRGGDLPRVGREDYVVVDL